MTATDRELAALGRALDFILSLADNCDEDRRDDADQGVSDGDDQR